MLSALGLAVVESPHVALVLAPALLLLLTLSVGVFPGERTLARARLRRLRHRRIRPRHRAATPVLPDVVRPSGITRAFALAMRPPPVLVAGS